MTSLDKQKISTESIIDAVRQTRNNFIKTMLKGDNLALRYQSATGKELTKVRAEFLKRDLSELLIAPVDLVYYSPIIKKLQGNSATEVPLSDWKIFEDEIFSLFKKYNYETHHVRLSESIETTVTSFYSFSVF